MDKSLHLRVWLKANYNLLVERAFENRKRLVVFGLLELNCFNTTTSMAPASCSDS